jgi:acetylornithine deacetylase/succinyl-diaminopimelate desuccinylase-like protein
MASGIVPTSWRLLGRLLARIEDPATGEIIVPELRAEVPADHRRAAQAAAALVGDPAGDLPTVPGLVTGGHSAAERLVRRAWSPTLTVTGVDGLPAPQVAGNVLRPWTTAKVSLRLPPTLDAAAARRTLEALLVSDPPDGATVSVRFGAPADGWVAPTPAPWVSAALTDASIESLGREPASQGEGGTIPFLAMLGQRYPGTPLVATGVLGPGSNAHGPNEYLHLPMAEAVTVATARVCAAAATTGAGR